MTISHFFSRPEATKWRPDTLGMCDFSCVELRELLDFYTRDLNIFLWQSRRFAHCAMLIDEVGLISHYMMENTDLLLKETKAEQEGRWPWC